ncbi:MAG: YbaB/EbfC family nucleoid-associated protein [Mucilaginibacter polytrichastri]|nr:YbaB/EbfC family nucleoid-associated protein [Mucilaginibacter polytrichastri]
MFDKILEAQKQAEEIKKRLETITVTGEAEGGKVIVESTAGKTIKNVRVDESLLSAENREELEDLLVVALNKALEQADRISATEMQAATQNMFGNLGNLFNQ